MLDPNKINERIKALGTTQEAVAKHMGMTRGHFWKVIHNKHRIRLDDADKLARYLLWEVQDLIYTPKYEEDEE